MRRLAFAAGSALALLFAWGAVAHHEPAFLIEGRAVATKADPPCWPDDSDPAIGDRFLDCGNLTVFDTVTQLFWHRFPACWSNVSLSWWDAQEAVGSVGDLGCLFDNSQPQDWRLPTQEEWESILEPDCPNAPKIAGKAGGCNEGANEWISEFGLELLYWTGTSDPDDPSRAFAANLTAGAVGSFDKDDAVNFVWVVRDAD